MQRPTAAIFILTRNTPERRAYLKTCLYFLFKNYDAERRYPVRVFHEGDYDSAAEREVLLGVRASCRDLVTFVALDPDDFALPSHIDRGKLARTIATQPVPYWRDERYRLMCRWWLVHMPRYAAAYDWVMRLDDDSIIEERVEHDPIVWAATEGLVYVSNLLHVDCGVCCSGLRAFFESLYPDRHDRLAELFTTATLPGFPETAARWRELIAAVDEIADATPGENRAAAGAAVNGDLSAPVIWYNNFFVTRTAFWSRPDVHEAIRRIDEHGGIFYRRWGDAPLQTLLVAMHARREEVGHAPFAYSKRWLREATAGGDGATYGYMPERYDDTSCVTARAPARAVLAGHVLRRRDTE